ncbi:Vacuolar protein sorting-associated protein 20 [Coemansia javaensis]|uniref:Vacuolar protein sorting-associated protein 20 n=1 Tax=Coemansia javaensis TaxID=2761396 RepID=A0A9W8H0E7_9FUNG|nr:Vacuolar protein sorting-associated protein 20 [Coemansia javaensis]
MGAEQSKHRVTAQDKAVLDMKVQRDKLKQYQRRAQAVLEREDQLARELLRRGDRRRALLALRRRKYQQQMMDTADQQLFNLQQLVETVEFSLVQRDVLAGLEQGNRVLTRLNREMRIEDVERLAAETADAIAYQEEVAEILSSAMSPADEDAVAQELELLERQEADRLRLAMPYAPQHALPEQQQQQPAAAAAASAVGQGNVESEEPLPA